MSPVPAPSPGPLGGARRVWVTLGSLWMVGCVSEGEDVGFIASSTYLAAAHNCQTLQTVSAPVCVDDHLQAICLWSGDEPRWHEGGVTAVPALTCGEGLNTAARLAQAQELKCRITSTPPAHCEEGDTAQGPECDLLFYCDQHWGDR